MADNRLILDWTKVQDVVPVEKELSNSFAQLTSAKKQLAQGEGKGHEFMGWVQGTLNDSPKVLKDIKNCVEMVGAHSNAVVVVGIGGSLLGTKAVYESLTHSFAQVQPANLHNRPLLFWAGHHVSTDELVELMDVLDGFSPTLIVVSKSGTTTEPALSFRILKKYLENRYGEKESSHRIVTITDPESGTLRKMSLEKKYPMFTVPRNIGGRYSIFTAVGLLPLAIAGIDVDALVAGAVQAATDCVSDKNDALETNVALCYAGIRNALYAKGYKIESLCSWTPKLKGIAEWWKQLFGESDGKNLTGIFPASANFTTDLHSLGQYFQEGERHMFATHMKIMREGSRTKGTLRRLVNIPSAGLDDGFDFLEGEDLGRVQNDAQLGTFLAHADGKVPTMVWELPELNAYWLGYWQFTNMFACGVGGLARGINPFDQPGVEAYKLNMFALLGKPGFEKSAGELRARLERGSRLKSFGLSTHS
jgi:glucose-6-phosphate isomerase